MFLLTQTFIPRTILILVFLNQNYESFFGNTNVSQSIAYQNESFSCSFSYRNINLSNGNFSHLRSEYLTRADWHRQEASSSGLLGGAVAPSTSAPLLLSVLAISHPLTLGPLFLRVRTFQWSLIEQFLSCFVVGGGGGEANLPSADKLLSLSVWILCLIPNVFPFTRVLV